MEKLKTVWYIERIPSYNVIQKPTDYKIKSFKYNWVSSTTKMFQLRQKDLILDVFCLSLLEIKEGFSSKKEALQALKKVLIKWHRDKEKELLAIDKKLLKVSKEISKCQKK